MDVEALIEEKNKAVANEDFLRAADIKKQLMEVDIQALVAEKLQAVADEDYLRAAELKKVIDLLTVEQGGGSSAGDGSASATKSAPSVIPKKASTPPKVANAPLLTISTEKIRTTPVRKNSSFNRKPPSRTPSYVSDGDEGSNVSSNNPIKSDPQLKAMIERINEVDSHRAFKMWKSSFLNRFEEFLTQEGTAPAQTAYNEFRKRMAIFVKQVMSVQGFVDKGELSMERTTVKGRNSLNEMNKQLVEVTAEERELIPSKTAQEKKRGYTKFHLGAVLVRDGFKEYQRMSTCCEILLRLKETSLQGLADKQQLEEIENYDRAMKRFRDIMADLGLYDVMLKAWEYGEGGEEFIFIDLKTGAIGGIPIKTCLEKGFIHTKKDDKGNDIAYREAITDEDDKNAVLSLVKEVLKF